MGVQDERGRSGEGVRGCVACNRATGGPLKALGAAISPRATVSSELSEKGINADHANRSTKQGDRMIKLGLAPVLKKPPTTPIQVRLLGSRIKVVPSARRQGRRRLQTRVKASYFCVEQQQCG